MQHIPHQDCFPSCYRQSFSSGLICWILQSRWKSWILKFGYFYFLWW